MGTPPVGVIVFGGPTLAFHRQKPELCEVAASRAALLLDMAVAMGFNLADLGLVYTLIQSKPWDLRPPTSNITWAQAKTRVLFDSTSRSDAGERIL